MGGMQRHLMQGQNIGKGSQCEYIETDGACVVDLDVANDYIEGRNIVCEFYSIAYSATHVFLAGGSYSKYGYLIYKYKASGLFPYYCIGADAPISQVKAETHRYQIAQTLSATARVYNVSITESASPIVVVKQRELDSTDWSTISLSSTDSAKGYTGNTIQVFGYATDSGSAGLCPSGTRCYSIEIDGNDYLPWYLDGEYGLMRQDTGEFFGKSYGTGTLTGVIL